MADKAKKPLVTPVAAKNIAAAKAAWSGGSAPTNSTNPINSAKAAGTKVDTPTGKPGGYDKKEEPKEDPKATAAVGKAGAAGKGAPAVPAGKGAPATAAKEPPKPVEPPKPEPVAAPVAPAKPQHANNSRKHDSDESSSEESSDESDASDSEDESEKRAKAKKIDIGVSLSSIKAAFQQDNQARQQIKKGYDAEEFKREVKEAGTSSNEVGAENEPEKTSADIKGAVLTDLGLDVVRKANIRGTKDRFEHGMADENGTHAEREDLQVLKDRSVVSGDKSKWEKPEELIGERESKSNDPDIEVAACKARKMKEKFEKKVRKEEKKNKTPKPKPRGSIHADQHE